MREAPGRSARLPASSLGTTFLSSRSLWTWKRSLASLSEGRSRASRVRRVSSKADGFRSGSPLLSSEAWGG